MSIGRWYGHPQIFGDPKKGGEEVGVKRVGRFIKQEGIQGDSRRWRGPKTTTHNKKDARPSPADLVERNFATEWLESSDRRLGHGHAPAHGARP